MKLLQLATVALALLTFLGQIGLAQEDSVVVAARGGGIVIEPGNPNTFADLKLSVSAKNARGVSLIRGEVTHPYGEGPFDVHVASADVVGSASVSTFPDQIHFEVYVSPTISDELVELFSAKPVTQTSILGRPGNAMSGPGYDNYPYRISWMSLQVLDDAGDPVEVSPKTDPVTRSTDVATWRDIFTEGFEEEVDFVALYAMNGVTFYPPRKIWKMGKDHYWFSWGLDGLQSLPLTFEVRLRNGAQYLFEYPRLPSSAFTLSPPSAVAGWEHYLTEQSKRMRFLE